MKCGKILKNQQGLTLVELMVVMAIAGLVLAAVFQMYTFQEKNAVVQEQVTDLQQNLRAAMYLLQRDIRMAGYDPLASRNFGITGINLNTITFTGDFNTEDGVVGANETITYSLFDFGGDGNMDLARNDAGVDELLAENIAAIGFAYAFDSDSDDQLDTYASGAGDQVIWAFDSDNNGTLDKNLDTNNDGVINQNDLGASGVIEGQNIFPVATDRIRAVRIWLLARSPNADTAYADTNNWVVGNQVINTNDNFRRRLLEATVQCRNMGLN